MAFKNNLDLLRLLEGPCRYYFNRGKFQSHLFAQLTSDSVRWLLSCFNETSRQTPSGSRSKTMFQYQHSPLIIDDNSRSSDGKARVSQAHRHAPKRAREVVPDTADKILEHLVASIA